MDLAPYNTFKVSVQAPNFRVVAKESDLPREPFLALGEGANILLTKDVNRLVVKNELLGQKVTKEEDDFVEIEMGSGENWHQFVMWAVENNLSGIENLALIPGTVGAAPVQNLAAYGQNVGEAIVSVSGINLETRESQTLSYADCNLYYRDSIFKHALKDKFFITKVTFKLFKTAHYDTGYYSLYESLKDELPASAPYTPKQIAQAVINMRMKKLPDWHKIGTAGSFFKNPFVRAEKYAAMQKEDPKLQAYPVNKMLYPNPGDPVFKLSGMVKIPAGRLLDQLGWRGKKIGRVGTFDRHALVVVNLGGATGAEILEFTAKMQAGIKSHFDIDLESEVNIL